MHTFEVRAHDGAIERVLVVSRACAATRPR